jgi:hypothetical protein
VKLRPLTKYRYADMDDDHITMKDVILIARKAAGL